MGVDSSYLIFTMTLIRYSISRRTQPIKWRGDSSHIDEVTQLMRASAFDTSPVAAILYLSFI